ncbi:hypothetical protein CJNNKLLH_3118 [Methylorubrum thiocyanatum]|nr:hypothetical protein CJNNKLLH_3118 [Methylorubrum thiocyanatum]
MGAEDAVDEIAADLAQALDLALFEGGAEPVGIVAAGAAAVPGLDLDLVERAPLALHARDIEPIRVDTLERDGLPAGEQAGGLGLGQDRADLPGAGRDLMRSQHAEGVAVVGRHDGGDRIGMEVAVAGLRRGAAHPGRSTIAAQRIRRPGRAGRLGRA